MFKKIIAAFCVMIVYTAVLSVLLGGFTPQMSVMSEEKSGVSLPVIMYHSILKDTARSGKYVITPSTLDSDIKYLHSKGYTTVSAAQVIDYVENNSPLPQNPIMLTFDDGCYNNYFYAVPILKDNNARGIFSIVGAYTDEYTDSDISNPNYGYLKWSDVYEMYVSENCEIGNHSYDFHKSDAKRNGSKKRSNEDTEEYKQIFRQDTEILQNKCYENCGFYPIIYTYPYGLYSKESIDVLKDMGFKMSFSCEEGINKITHNPDDLYLLKRYNRPSGISSEVFLEKILN